MQRLLLMLVLFSTFTHANAIKAVLKGGQLYWQNAYYKNDVCNADQCLVPSFWVPVSELTPTTRWIPGGVVRLGDSSLRVYNAESMANIELDFQLVGIEYNTGSIKQDIGSDTINLTPHCPSVLVNSLVLSLSDASACFYNKVLELQGSRQEPFAFIRPIFAVNETEIKKKFQDNGIGLPIDNGLYSSQIMPFSYLYDYYFDPVDANAPAHTRRYMNSFYSLEIEHVSSYINVQVDKMTKQMDVMYYPDGRIEGSGFFKFIVSGVLNNGFTLSISGSPLYELEGPENKKIPYSINWRETNQELKFGQVESVNDEQCHITSGQECIRYLDASFVVSSEDDLVTGTYSDTLTVIFESNDF